jgi:predicted RNA-binding protein with PIN domain
MATISLNNLILKVELIELQAREGLIDQLSQYKRLKGHCAVVFDGGTGELAVTEAIKELVIFRVGEKADDVLKRLAAERRWNRSSLDQEVASFAGKKDPM